MNTRTKQESFQHILAEFDANRLGAMDDRGCLYEALDGKHCGVGCLFTPEQHAWIQERYLNSDSIEELAVSMGKESLFLTTGMSIDELNELQYYHDDEHFGEFNSSFTRDNFRNYLVTNAS